MSNRISTGVHLAVAASLMLPIASNAAGAAESGVLDEVVVTAQKRSQNIQDVPIAVTAVDSEAVLNAGIVNIQDLGQIVPTLTVSNAVGIGFSYLRGIGTTAIGPGIEYPVSMYMDGVYLASTTDRGGFKPKKGSLGEVLPESLRGVFGAASAMTGDGAFIIRS